MSPGGMRIGLTKVYNAAASRLSQPPIKMELDKSPIIRKVEYVFIILCQGKSPGPDEIPAQIVKRVGSKLVEVLHDITTKA